MVFSEANPHPVVHGWCKCMYAGPLIAAAFLTLLTKSSGYAIDAVATYGIPCAAIIIGMSFLGFSSPKLPLPFGEVVVLAP